MEREKLLPLIGKQGVKHLTISFKEGDRKSLMDYRIEDVGEKFLYGRGPGNGQSPIRLSAIKSIHWTEEIRHHIE